MAKLTYKIVEHDGGWAYKVGSTFSETFRTHQEALRAAEIAPLRTTRYSQATSAAGQRRSPASFNSASWTTSSGVSHH